AIPKLWPVPRRWGPCPRVGLARLRAGSREARSRHRGKAACYWPGRQSPGSSETLSADAGEGAEGWRQAHRRSRLWSRPTAKARCLRADRAAGEADARVYLYPRRRFHARRRDQRREAPFYANLGYWFARHG